MSKFLPLTPEVRPLFAPLARSPLAFDSRSSLPSPLSSDLLQYIARSKTTALTDALPRPITDDAPYFPLELLTPAQEMKDRLSIPRRPKWKYEHTKKEVEANEAGLFKKWLAGADAAVEQWRADEECGRAEEGGEEHEPASTSSSIVWPRSTTYFERNLEVYRQLWRTLELSPILLVLIDIRCPPLHFPPSLQEYILSHQQTSKKEVVLVLTKCDLVPDDVRIAWEEWCKREWGKHGWDIVSLEAYRREKRVQGTFLSTRPVLRSADLNCLSNIRYSIGSQVLYPARVSGQARGSHQTRSPQTHRPTRRARRRPGQTRQVDPSSPIVHRLGEARQRTAHRWYLSRGRGGWKVGGEACGE